MRQLISLRLNGALLLLSIAAPAFAQGPPGAPPPPPPPVPQFMAMKGYPLSCFDKPAFEEDGLEIFVCQGGNGLAGVRKKDDPAKLIWVGDADIARNLNMQAARLKCIGKPFGVTTRDSESFTFLCGGKEMTDTDKFKAATPARWKKYLAYLN